jgi:hypothetical protein
MAKQRKSVPTPATTKVKEVPFAEANTTVRRELSLLWDVLGGDFAQDQSFQTSPKKKLKKAA